MCPHQQQTDDYFRRRQPTSAVSMKQYKKTTPLPPEAATSILRNDDTQQPQKKKSSVSFGPVHVRHHERALLENAILELSWTHLPSREFSSVEEFYAATRKDPLSQIRFCTVEERTTLLCEYGFSEEEINRAAQEERSRRLRLEYMKYKERGERSSLNDLVRSIKSFGATFGKRTKRKRRKKNCRTPPGTLAQ